jgi:hypothetical protein
MKTITLLVLALAGIQPAFADFLNPSTFRAVYLGIEADGDPSTNPDIAEFGNPDGLFDPPLLSIGESSMEHGSASGSINHRSGVSLSSTLLTASFTDTGAGSSTPTEGHRGTLSAFSLFQLTFASDTSFTVTLGANLSHSNGSPGNGFSSTYGVTLWDTITSKTLAQYDLANPSGTNTFILPAGSYALDSLSGVSFDAVFGNPPAASYSSSFSSDWSFSAAALLAISFLDNEHAQIKWPTNATGYALQSTANLAAPAWAAITETPAVIGESFVLNLDATVGSKFYRLWRP